MRITIEGRDDLDSGVREQAITLSGGNEPGKPVTTMLLSFETGDGLQFACICRDRWRHIVEAGNLILGEGA